MGCRPQMDEPGVTLFLLILWITGLPLICHDEIDCLIEHHPVFGMPGIGSSGTTRGLFSLDEMLARALANRLGEVPLYIAAHRGAARGSRQCVASIQFGRSVAAAVSAISDAGDDCSADRGRRAGRSQRRPSSVGGGSGQTANFHLCPLQGDGFSQGSKAPEPDVGWRCWLASDPGLSWRMHYPTCDRSGGARRPALAGFATPYGLRYAAHCFKRADAQNDRPAPFAGSCSIGLGRHASGASPHRIVLTRSAWPRVPVLA